MKENIEQMLKNVASGDLGAAKEQFSYIITQKVADRLDDYKAEVGGEFMNTKLDEGAVGRMLGHPDSERGKANSAMLRKMTAGKGQKSIKSTRHFGGGREPETTWQSVNSGTHFKTEKEANDDHDNYKG
jgi:hypothetical protein